MMMETAISTMMVCSLGPREATQRVPDGVAKAGYPPGRVGNVIATQRVLYTADYLGLDLWFLLCPCP
jgi:hypothetical protein